MRMSAVRGFHGQIGGDESEDALSIPHGNRAGHHPDLAAPSIEVGIRPDSRVCGQWFRDPGLRIYVVGRHGKVQGGVAVGGAIDIGASSDPAVMVQQRRGAPVECGGASR